MHISIATVYGVMTDGSSFYFLHPCRSQNRYVGSGVIGHRRPCATPLLAYTTVRRPRLWVWGRDRPPDAHRSRCAEWKDKENGPVRLRAEPEGDSEDRSATFVHLLCRAWSVLCPISSNLQRSARHHIRAQTADHVLQPPGLTLVHVLLPALHMYMFTCTIAGPPT